MNHAYGQYQSAQINYECREYPYRLNESIRPKVTTTKNEPPARCVPRLLVNHLSVQYQMAGMNHYARK